MQISLHWLRDYVDVKRPVHDLAERLTETLSEVEEIRSTTGLADILVGELLAVTKHPNADTLWLTKVRVGQRTYRVVCGADNVSVGDKVPVALPGVTLPSGLIIGTRTIRGERSEGMLCSPRELGIGEDHTGIWLLPAGSITGQPITKVLGSKPDSFELDVLANRPDCLSHLGVAREVAAIFDQRLRQPRIRTPQRSIAGSYRVKLPGRGCSRYTLAYLTGLTNTDSPDWLRQRLNAVGQRPINAIVDVTNFVMLELGQPLHAVDAAQVDGQTISVRLAKAAETVETLDDQVHRLTSETLLIADSKKPLGLAGLIGAADARVTDRTTDILLESAHFDPAMIRRVARRIGLRTEASARFEKGITERMTLPAMRRTIDLIQEICGGKLAQLTDVYPKPAKPAKLTLDVEAMEDFLGWRVPDAKVRAMLRSLGFSVTGSQGHLTVTAPEWRSDIAEPVDLYEEVARLFGYDKFPATLPTGQIGVPTVPPLHDLTRSLRAVLTGAGLTEVVTHSLVGEDLLRQGDYQTAGLVEMANPLSEDHRFLRRNMQPRHLETVAANLRWRNRVDIFEMGTTFKADKSGKPPIEETKLLVTMADKSATTRLADARGILTLVAKRLHLAKDQLKFKLVKIPQFTVDYHILYKNVDIGGICEYRQARRFRAGRIVMLSLNLGQLAEVMPADWSVSPPPVYPSVSRDLSVFLPAGLAYAALQDVIVKAGRPLLREARDPTEFVQGGRRSLTVHLEFGADRTLTDNEVNKAMQRIERSVKRVGATVRS